MKRGKPKHRLYARNSTEIYPGSLRERSIERLGGEPVDKKVSYDMRVGGPLVEEFVDEERKLADFSRANGRDIFWLLRRVMIEQGRVGDPIPNPELEKIAISHGFFRIHARFALRDAWKLGYSRRFVRGIWIWARDGESRGGEKFGVHYMLVGSKNVRQAIKSSRQG